MVYYPYLYLPFLSVHPIIPFCCTLSDPESDEQSGGAAGKPCWAIAFVTKTGNATVVYLIHCTFCPHG